MRCAATLPRPVGCATSSPGRWSAVHTVVTLCGESSPDRNALREGAKHRPVRLGAIRYDSQRTAPTTWRQGAAYPCDAERCR